MNPSLKDQLKDVKLDFSTYARMPIREDVLIINPNITPEGKAILKQWETLQYLRKNLSVLDRYIQEKTTAPLSEWLTEKKLVMSKNAIDKIGGHNDNTGGISAYFLNLQNFYDQEEAKYDDMESKSTAPSELKMVIDDMRVAREKKRNERRDFRKIQTKSLKKDGKGYLEIHVEEPTVAQETAAADADQKVEETLTVASEAMVNTKTTIGVWITAGVVITIAAILISKSASKDKAIA